MVEVLPFMNRILLPCDCHFIRPGLPSSLAKRANVLAKRANLEKRRYACSSSGFISSSKDRRRFKVLIRGRTSNLGFARTDIRPARP